METTMSDFLLRDAPRLSWWRELRDWLRHASVAVRLPSAHWTPDDVMHDLGIERPPVPSVDVPTRLGLLDLGWQAPRRPRRR